MREKLLNLSVGTPSWLIAIVKIVCCVGEYFNWNYLERRSLNNISHLPKLVRSEWFESYWERIWRYKHSSVQPSRMPKPNKGKKPSWKPKAVKSAVTTKLENKPALCGEVSRKSLLENTKCPWCSCSGFDAQRCNPSWKKTEDMTGKD